MIFERLVVGPLQCNCFVIGCGQTHEAFIIDPGDEAERILEVLNRHQLRAVGILHTHAHFDHVGATKSLKEATNASVCFHPDDRDLYQNLSLQAAMFGLKAPEPTEVEHWLKDGEVMEAGSIAAQVIHTPGHSPGSACFLLPVPKKLLSGDTLFAGSIGRTDLWGGSHEQIMQSIRTRLLTLPDETEVYPGHGPPTTIEEEKRNNPFLQSFF